MPVASQHTTPLAAVIVGTGLPSVRPPHPVTPMRPTLTRLLLCLSLLGFGSAMAAESRQMGADDSGGQADTQPGSDRIDDEAEAGAPPPRRAGDAKPRPASSRNGSTTRATTPRWHSFLPGMIR